MERSWYQLRIPTFILAMILICLFVTKNACERDDGLLRVYLTENQSLAVAYRAWLRGWPETFAVKYVLDEEHTTTQGYPKKKYIEDKFFGRSLLINVFVALGALLGGIVLSEGTLRVFVRTPRAAAEPLRSHAMNAGDPFAARDAAPSIADVPTPRGRPITTRRPVSVPRRPVSKQERKGRPVSVKPAIAPQRIEALKRGLKK